MATTKQNTSLDFRLSSYLINVQLESDSTRAVASFPVGNMYQRESDGHLLIARKGAVGLTDTYLDATAVTDIDSGNGTAITITSLDTVFTITPNFGSAVADIGTANAGGSSNLFARVDHVHNHGDQPGGSLHALATIATAGFMSASDKLKLDNIDTGAEANQNAYSSLTGDSGNATSDSTTDNILFGGDGTYTTVDVTDIGGISTVIVNITEAAFDSRYVNRSGDTMTGDLDMGGNSITNMSDPTGDQDAATKYYVDQIAVNGVTWKRPARVTADSNIALSGIAPFSIDGINMADGDRVLLDGQTSATDNGIYDCNITGLTYTLTRSSDFDEDSEVIGGVVVPVTEGTTYEDTQWMLVSDDPLVVGVSPLDFEQTSGAASIVAGNGLSKTGNTLDVNVDGTTLSIVADTLQIAATYPGQTSITTLGTITTGSWNADVVEVAYGGTGLSSISAGHILYSDTANSFEERSFSSNFTVGADEIDLSDTGVSAGTYGSTTEVPIITVDAKGRLTAVSNQSINIGQADGDEYEIVDTGSTPAGGQLQWTANVSDWSVTINHAYGTTGVQAEGYVTSTGETVNLGIVRTDANNIVVSSNVDESITVCLIHI